MNSVFSDSIRNPSELHAILHETRSDENEEELHSKELLKLLKESPLPYDSDIIGITQRVPDDLEFAQSRNLLEFTNIHSGDSSPASRSGHSTSPIVSSTPNTPGNSTCYSDLNSNVQFVYPDSNGGLSPRPIGKNSVSCSPPGHLYSRAESHFPYAIPSSPCPEYKSRPSTTSLPPYPCFTTPRSHNNIITVTLPFGQYTKVKHRNKLKETILKRLTLRNISVEDCRFYQIYQVPAYQPQKVEISLDAIDQTFSGNELVIEHKNSKIISNSPHKFTKKKLHMMKLCLVCKKSLFKDFFMCEKCKGGFHEKCLQMDFVCTAGAIKNEHPIENTIRNGVHTADRKSSSALGFRSRSNSEPKDPLEVISPPPTTPNLANGHKDEPVMTKYLVPIGEKIEFAPKFPHKGVSNANSFPNNPNNTGNKQRISESSYSNKSNRPQHKISLQHPLHDYTRNMSADSSVKNKRSLGGLADHENLRSKSISNLDTVVVSTSPDPILPEMRVGSAPTSPKSNTPPPTSRPLMVSIPTLHKRDPIFSSGEPSPTILLRNHKPSNAARSSTWVVRPNMVKFGELIGQGSYGTVYKGEYHGTVAIKMLTCSDPGPEQLDAFNEEIEMLRQTRHDNILLFMGYIPYPFAILTSWCDGNTLYFHLHISEEEIPQDKMNQIVLQTAQGMSYLHTSRKIIHRDLKSQNIFLLSDYTVKIGDFGLATMKSRWSGPKQFIEPQGSLLWMAPEVMRAGTDGYKDPYSFRSDVYSFGIVLYEIITGDLPPFKDQNMHILLFQIGLGILRPEITFVRKNTPNYLVDLCGKCISFDKDERPLFSDFCEKLETELFCEDTQSDIDRFIIRKISRRVSETNIADLLDSWPIILDRGLAREIQTLPHQTPT
ncbi:Serine/threonine-protein kinase B-raf like [Oopsacas minuta]|uniref:Serine/threonine-protein kinase B-raf like n=1 Tax=Oopsacas minuta TaxID=111878 RepID=A0AAV7JYS6_9METZ|nr:Serine/threonine-protein kinase B-raf like [Oopsacas minuta]